MPASQGLTYVFTVWALGTSTHCRRRPGLVPRLFAHSAPLFSNYTSEYYPHADALVDYLGDFAAYGLPCFIFQRYLTA